MSADRQARALLRFIKAIEDREQKERDQSEPPPVLAVVTQGRLRPLARQELPEAKSDPKHGTWGYYLSYGSDRRPANASSSARPDSPPSVRQPRHWLS